MDLKPLNDNVIIEPDPLEFYDENPEIVRILNEGTIKLPESYEAALKKVSPTGTIISWGERCHYDHKKGEKIYFRQFSGTNLKYGKKQYKVINEWDIIAKVEVD